MKKVVLLCLSILLCGIAAIAQPTLITYADFEGGIPAGWNTNNSTNVTPNVVLKNGGLKSIRLKNASTGEVWLETPTLTRNAGCNVRVEFEHIPMLQNPEGQGEFQISTNNGATWMPLTATGGISSPTGYDATYGGGITGWLGYFVKTNYWSGNTNILETNLDSTYWKHEVFYLNSAIGNSTTFKLRFRLNQASTANTFSGWYIDDFRVYQASTAGNTVRIPQLLSSNIISPTVYNYPNCSDVKIDAIIGYLQSAAPTVADSIYVEYKFGNNPSISRINLGDSSNGHYVGFIPFNGFDSITYWRIVANDVKYNKTTYPYSFNRWNSFKSIRSEDTSMTLQTSGISNQEIMMKTNQARNMYQFRYKATELIAKGFKSGKLFRLGYKVTNASGPFYMNDFSVYITNLSPSTTLSGINPYSGNMQQVMGPIVMTAPPVGEQELVFDNYFIWDGQSDILIKVCWDNGANNTTGGTTKIESIVAPAGYLTGQMYSIGGYANACTSPFNTSDGQIGYRPNFKFIFKKDCTLKYDAGVNDTLVNPAGMVVNSNVNVPITIKINNYGSETLNNVIVYTQIDNNPVQMAGTWSGTLLPGSANRYRSINYSLPNGLTFTPGYRHVKIWTDSIIGQIDWEPKNDTALYQNGYFGIVSCNGPLNGTYAIGNVTGITADRTFATFKEAFAMLKGCGVSGPVTFKVLNLPAGTFYTDSLAFPTNISGASITNYIKFTSASPNQYVNYKPVHTTNKSFDFAGAKYLKFEKFNFYSADSFAVVNDTLRPGIANIIDMNNQTSNIDFKDCGFIRNPNSVDVNPNYFINIGAAKYITIDSCRIDGKAVFNHIFIQGNSPTSLTEGITIKKTLFTNFSNESISINYAKDVVIDKNEFINNLTTSSNSNYNLMISSSKNFSITKNKFIINNVSAIGVNLSLPSTTPSVIANNKISIHNNNVSPSTANIFGINFMSGNDVRIANNNIYARDLNSDGLLSFAMVIGNGSTTQPLANIAIKNNIIVSDGYGVAVHAKTTTQSIINFSNNIYYKLNTLITPPSTILWRYNTTNCSTLDEWNTALGGTGDLASTIYGPLFPAFENLSTTNTYVCYKGTPVAEVTDDYNYRLRNTTQPCIGADEFSPPPSNISVLNAWIDRGDVLVAPDGNTLYSACGLGNEYINIQFKNISNNTILADNLKFWYKIDNLTIPNSQKDTIHHTVIPDSIYTYRFRNPYNFAVTTADREFKVTAFSVLAADTIRTNDTTVFYVNSRAQLTALPAQNLSINYGDSALLSVTANDSVYWFLRNTDEIPVLKSHTYQTNRLYNDTTFYFSRKEEIPMLKISEIQISKLAGAIGQTVNLPSWINANCAIELSNYGNGAINLNGYQLAYVTGNIVTLSSTMSKTYTFGNYTIYPNTSVVIQVANGTTPDSLKTLYIGSATNNYTASSKTGFILKDATGAVIDAVTYNGATFNAATNVPASVWTGPGKIVPNNTAGLIRTNRSAIDSTGWIPSVSETPLTISTLDSTQIWKRDNGCFGFKAPYNITVSGIPTIDPGVASIKLVGINHLSVCTLTDENVEVKITNTGVSSCTSTPLLLKVYDGTTLINTVYDTCNVTVAPNDTITYIIPQTINLAANTSDKIFTIICNSNHSSDVIHLNDTARMQITSLMTPYAPISSSVSIPYASSSTLTASGHNSTDVLIWYNNPTTIHELDRVNYTTPILYENDTFYVGAMLLDYDTIQLGDSNIANINSGYPSPFNGNLKNLKEQYLYKASELRDLGFVEGNINSIMFNIMTATGTTTLYDYTVKLGTTNEESLTTWITGLTEVFKDSINITNSSDNYGWRNLQFNDPFYYDGTSNLVVEICFYETTAKQVRTYYSSTPFASSISYRHNSTNACAWTGSPIAFPSNIKFRPNTRFNIDKFGCSSVRTPVAVNVAAAPDCEAGLTEITNPATSIVMSGLSIPIKVKLKNYGSAALTSTPIHWAINGIEQTPYTWTGNLAPRDTQTVTIGNHIFISGINTINAWTNLTCDSIHTNDSVSFSFSACIGNDSDTSFFTIGTGGNYPTINDAVSALISSGICGHVVFDINPKVGGYNEQITITIIAGTENGNTITFRGNALTNDSVILTYQFDSIGGNTDKYVLKLDGTSNVKFENLRFNNFDTNYTSVVEITNNSSNIYFNGVVISSLPRIRTNNEVTNLLKISGVNDNLTFNNMVFNGGATSLYSDLPDSNSSKVSITNSFFNRFAFKGIDIKGIKELYITKNKFREYANANVSSAISISNISNILEIVKNDIYLEGGTAIRTGMDVKKVDASVLSPAVIANNSISLSGTYTNTALNYIGLNIDSTNNTNIYYNTIKVRASNNSGNSKSLNIGTNCSRIKVLNNNLDNSSKGFAYYVTNPSTQVMASNNNNYITNGLNPIYWLGNKQTVAALQTVNSQDAMSLSIYNPFASDSILNIIYPSEIVRSAEPLDGYIEDILGNFRPMSPRPTIGAYEFQFTNVDFGPTQIITPDSITNYLENDPMTVTVKVKNFGLYGIDSVRITAHLKYNADTSNIIQTISQSFVQNISSLSSVDFTLSDFLYPPLHFRSVTDKLHLCVYTTVYGDTIRINDTIHTNLIIIPAYNLQAVNTVPITERCKLFQTPVQMTIKNVGEKPIGLNDSLWVSYQVEGRPDIYARELLLISPSTPYNDGTTNWTALQKSQQLVYTFNTLANFYPLGLIDTTWRLRTIVSLNNTQSRDNVRVNDTSLYILVNSRVSPPKPITHDTMIYYGTWAEPWASQINSLPIKWYADSTSTPFYSPSNYAQSMKYRTSQLFTDSTFYLRVNLAGSYPCESYYTPVRVTLLDRANIDGAAIGLQGQGPVEPPLDGWVYMTSADTIKVKVSNYGTMPMQNFDITYSIQKASPANSPIINVTERCTQAVAPDASLIYKFDSLADFSAVTNYKIRAWVDVPNDSIAVNDTSAIWLVKAKNGNTIYPNVAAANANSLDITRVQMGNMDNASNNSGIAYTDYTNTITPVTLFKGIYDSIYISCDKPSNLETENQIGGWVRVFIDWDRNGIFEPSELTFNDTIWSDSLAKGKINVPSNTLTGYTRMRVMLWQGRSSLPFNADESPSFGEVEDYKVLIRNTTPVNAELVKFTQPGDFLNNQTNDIRVVLRNTGTTALSSATINWTMNGTPDILNWNGYLAPADRVEVTLRANATIPTGLTQFVAWVDATDDSYHQNDTIRKNTYIIKTFTVPYTTAFDDEGYDDFYAPNSNPLLPTNCWEFGTPDPTNITINGPYSTPNCWKTKLSGKYPEKNESILYSPIFNIGLIKPDTMTFMMRRAINSGTYIYIDYKKYGIEGEWARLGIINDPGAQNWYNNDSNRFQGNAIWTRHLFSLQSISRYLGNSTQFRFVFRSGSSVNDGVAIDNFEIKRALRPQDAGVVKIDLTPNETPTYGSTFYPKVRVRNYGSEKLYRYTVCYTAEGMHIPRCEEVFDTNGINPRETKDYTFSGGRVVFDSLPNPFNICAFTRLNPTDLYSDNDSLCEAKPIGPLQKDVKLLEILEPTEQVVANNDINVIIHIKNIGIDRIDQLPVAYKLPGHDAVVETITFSPALYRNEEYHYTFNTPFHSSYGTTNLKVWTALDGDYYRYNDTLYRRVTGAITTQDLEAKYLTIDDYPLDQIGVQLTFSNNSSVGIDSITVGYYYNGDRTNAHEETFRSNATLVSGQLGHHYFAQTLPRANAPYHGICGYVKIPNDNNRENDTTCTLYMGIRDAKADTIFVENTSDTMSKVQLRARNIGTLGVPIMVNAGYVINGDWLNPVVQSFDWTFGEPNSNQIYYMTFAQRIPRMDNGVYDIVAWVDYPYDANRSNDTTMTYKVVDLIGLDEEPEVNEFTLNQNVPNPLNNSTTISFSLPNAGKTRFMVINNMGQLIISENKFYSEGKHEIVLDKLNLPQGIYYYAMEFEGKKITKKMIVTR